MAYNPRQITYYRSSKRPTFGDSFKQAAGSALAEAVVGLPQAGLQYLTQRGLQELTNDPVLRQQKAAADLSYTQAAASAEQLEMDRALRAKAMESKASGFDYDIAKNAYEMKVLRETGDAKIAATAAEAAAKRMQSEYDQARLGAGYEELGMDEQLYLQMLQSQSAQEDAAKLGASRATTDLTKRQTSAYDEDFLLRGEAQSLAERKFQFEKDRILAGRELARAAALGAQEAAAKKEWQKNYSDRAKALESALSGAKYETVNENGKQVSRMTPASKALVDSLLMDMRTLEISAPDAASREMIRSKILPLAENRPVGRSYIPSMKAGLGEMGLGAKVESPQDELARVNIELARMKIAYDKETNPLRKRQLESEIAMNEAYARRLGGVVPAEPTGKSEDGLLEKGWRMFKGAGGSKKNPPLKTGGGSKGSAAVDAEYGE